MTDERTAKLEYCGNFLEICHFSHSKADAEAGNPYNTTLHIRVKSGEFCGVGFCECDIKEFCRFVRELGEMYEFQRSCAVFDDICYGSEVTFESDRTGHLTVSGIVHGRGMIHSLKFEFAADQTVLPGFIKSINELLL